MEHGIGSPKVVLTGILAMLMVCVVAAPALAQADAQGGDVQIQNQYCPQVVNQYANAVQNNSGGGIAAGIAQNLDISQSAVNACIQAGGDININENGDGGDTPAEDQYAPDDGNGDGTAEERTMNVGSDEIIVATIPNKVLANTGGAVAPSSLLLPAGALLVVSGMMMAFWLGNRRG